MLRRTADVAGENFVAQREPGTRDQQAHHDLRLLWFVVFGETRHAQRVGLEGLEVQGGHIVQHQGKPIVQAALGEGYRDVLGLGLVLLHGAQRPRNRSACVMHTEVFFELCDGPELGAGFHQPHDRQVKQHRGLQLGESASIANGMQHLVQQSVRCAHVLGSLQ